MAVQRRERGRAPGRDRAQRGRGQLDGDRQRSYAAPGARALGVELVGAPLADVAQGGGDAAVQLAAGLLEVGEGERAERIADPVLARGLSSCRGGSVE
ncbi:MAG: hypothetical protein EXR63_05795 [Dehalococcoidia bacterium]|nr:hypothetical protein [Dehalococcoidia bacterium]